ncbi:MAG: cysteine desulfurase family protein, partial [Selenomonadaceae bacterium]
MKPIYFDYAATTPTDQEVAALMADVMVHSFGNPSSVHGFGREALAIVAKARRQLAELIGARPQEIVYTSGGSESDNLALKGAAYACRQRGNHIVTTAIEHHALLHSCQQLEGQGFTVTYLQPDKDGRIDPAAVSAALRDETILISVMFANNEVGTVQPIREIGALARDRGIWFHTDAVQAAGHLPIDV